jgi:hypothetical protein
MTHRFKDISEKTLEKIAKAFDTTLNFGMFSSVGNLKVKKIIDTSKTFEEAHEKLVTLSSKKGFEEALDTAVTDYVSLRLPSVEEDWLDTIMPLKKIKG